MNPLRLVMRWAGAQTWFPPVAKRLMPLDATLQQRTDGRLALMALAGLDSLVLTTTGRRTGRQRKVALLCVDGPGGYVVAGSNWGGTRHPAWSANLLAHPSARIAVRGRVVPVTAKLATGVERERLWQLLVAAWPAYDAYQGRTDREIRVFTLATGV